MKPNAWRALVVDDNAINLEVAIDLMVHLGLRTDSASGGIEAVALAQAVAYDLIVMDVQMPDMDGITATRQIRRQRGLSPPIIALTANASADDRDACLAAGMTDYLTKPVEPQQLQRALQRWLPGWAQQAPPSVRGATRAPDVPVAPDAPSEDLQLQSRALQLRLASIAGFDLAGSLCNLGGRIPTLERVLRRFVATYRAGEPQLVQAARQGDAAALWQVCHSLRGACAVLCANALVQHIEALESALLTPRTPATLLAQAQPLQAELVALVQELDAALALR